MNEMFDKLAAPFPADRVSWRVGSVKKDGTAAMALAYIDARDVMERLDEACGPGGWQCRYPHAERKTVCDVGVKVGDEWIWKSDGAGDSDIEAEKGALSDAFKRAAVRWGVGRYLYELPSPWVKIDQYKKILPEEEAKLRKMLEGRAAPPRVAVQGVITGRQLQEAQERPEYDPEPPLGSNRLSSFEATRQGLGESIKNFIDNAKPKELDIWEKNFDRNTAHLPASWLEPLRDRIQLRREELAGEANVAEADGELTEAFRATMGGAGVGSVPGSDAHAVAT